MYIQDKKILRSQPFAIEFSIASHFEVVAIDLVSIPVSRAYNHLLTIIDLKSRLLVAVPLSNIHAETVANFFFKCWICVYDAPSVVYSDKALQFVSSVFKSLRNNLKIAVTHSSSKRKLYNRKSLQHGTLKKRLRPISGNWADNIPRALHDLSLIHI